jgi:hypothetical protein
MDDLGSALADAGGVDAPRERGAQLRTLLGGELAHGRAELGKARSGREHPVLVAFVAAPAGLAAVTPAPATLRADPQAGDERTWLLVGAAVAALADAVPGPLQVGELDGHLVVVLDGRADGEDAELAALAFEERAAGIDRLRTRALALPAHVLDGELAELREPIGAAHPLRVAAAGAGLQPLQPEAEPGVARPHDDPDPARRVARRILQRLNGMGKWGGYHTDFKHLARGFAGNDRKLAEAVGEALLESGLLAEKPSVGQRHVFLNPRRAGDIHTFIERGEAPRDLTLP